MVFVFPFSVKSEPKRLYVIYGKGYRSEPQRRTENMTHLCVAVSLKKGRRCIDVGERCR